MPAKMKNPAAVALGRKGGKKGGLARAANLTPEQRSESARKAVQARWAKVFHKRIKEAAPVSAAVIDSSDHALLDLLKRLKKAKNPAEVRRISGQLERVIFHKQYKNA
jgi:hypothetical protein